MHAQRYRRTGEYELPVRQVVPWKTCTIDGCSNKARTRKGALCETHYYRRYRTGSFNGPDYKRRYNCSHGYVVLSGVEDSPIKTPNGLVYEHRKILFDAIGDGEHACHWCGRAVRWGDKGKTMLVVDHLDADKKNNRLDNLVPSCNRCNGRRGFFMTWVMDHRDDPFLANLFEAALSQSA